MRRSDSISLPSQELSFSAYELVAIQIGVVAEWHWKSLGKMQTWAPDSQVEVLFCRGAKAGD